MHYLHHYDSPLGGITLAADGTALIGLWFDGQRFFADTLGTEYRQEPLPVFARADRWLDVYFSGREPDFLPPIALADTPFRLAVWEILTQIPYGQTVTYGQIADRLAKERGVPRMSAQAVGGAVGRNPVSLMIPCHRVIGADGALTGYAGGTDIKRRLLRLEGAELPAGEKTEKERGCRI